MGLSKIEKVVKTVKDTVCQLKRIWVDIVACASITGALYAELHEKLPPSMQLMAFKLVLVSMAVTHAHISGKLLFGKVNWSETDFTPKKVLRISLYIVFVVAYSMGG